MGEVTPAWLGLHSVLRRAVGYGVQYLGVLSRPHAGPQSQLFSCLLNQNFTFGAV